jgi:ABC-type multidrug transport system fused ATPase/permease subunit
MLKMIKRLPVGRTTLAIVFLFVQIICSLYLPYLTADIVNKGVVAGNTAFIWTQGFWMILLSVCGLAGAVLNTLFFSKISYRLGMELRQDLFNKVLKFSRHEFDKIGASSLITRNTNDITQVQTLVEMALKFLILSAAYLIGGIILTWQLSPSLAMIFVWTIPFLVVAYFVIFRFASPLYAGMQKLLDKLNLYFREAITGVKVVRAFGKEEQDFERYSEVNQAYAKTSIKAGTIMSLFIPGISMLLGLATVLITWNGSLGIAAGTIDVGSLIGAVGYSALILTGFAMLTAVILAVPRGQISATRINEVLDMPLSINDPEHNEKAGADCSLTFEDVDFRYFGAEKKTISGINVTVHQGQTLALIGSTGEGKSSLVQLITRLYDVEEGHIRINGADVRSLPQDELHKMVSFSPQASTLFMGTIRSNMLVGRPDAADDEIWAALDIAQASEFVRKLPDGIDSPVEKGGGNFSGGQKQRLCIARTLLKDAGIYIFDDSFSALDFKTDAMVRAAMKDKLKSAITVIVAQRISTVMDADLIAVLDKGTLAGLGTHEELSRTNPVYREIIDSQVYKEVAV